MFTSIEQLQELIKSYYIALRYDEQKARNLLITINQLRLEIALDAEVREIFYAQTDFPANATGFQVNKWFSKNDINYAINRAIAHFNQAVTIAAINQGNQQRIITREPLAWQQIFPGIQSNLFAQQTLFDLPQEIFFGENEAIGITVQGQTVGTGFIFWHGCTLKDTLEETKINEIKNEIDKYLPEPQLVPLVFEFPSAVAGTLAVNAAGGDEIFSSKNERSIILTEISTTATLSRLTLIDEGRNQLICQRVEMAGIASNFENRFTTYYKLPYPHLLRKGDRIRCELLNGSLITATQQAANIQNFLTLKGYSM